jgi:phosphoglycerate dehydrogenase-like enzyme
MSGIKCKVLTTSTWISDEMKQLLPRNCELIVSESRREEDLLRLVGDVDVLVGVRATRKVIEKAKKLRMIQALGTGVDRIDIDVAAERGIVVCNAVGLNAVPVAEHAMALMLSLAKNVVRYDKRLRGGGWRAPRIPSVLLRGKTLGIVGLGSIGIEVCKRAKAFGMKVIALKRSPSEELKTKLGIDFLGSQGDLHRILRQSDFVVLSVVLTPETRKMIGEKELRMMKRTAYLVNISRGGVIDEDTLANMLEEGVIAGAGIDVFEVEPINPDNPLLQLENVVLTPHVAGGGGLEELKKERVEFIVGNIAKVMSGQTPEKIVDSTLKYVIKDYWSLI